MLTRKLLLTGLLVFSIGFFLSETSFADLTCAFEDSSNISKCSYRRPSIDTIRTLAIYCTPHLAANTLLSYWMIVSSRSRIISTQA